jgi:hypothetical protein
VNAVMNVQVMVAQSYAEFQNLVLISTLSPFSCRVVVYQGSYHICAFSYYVTEEGYLNMGNILPL